MIKTLVFDDVYLKLENYVNENLKGPKEIGKLSRINIFVGPNNSGKSRFLRNIAKAQNYQIKYEPTEFNELDRLILDFRSELISKIGHGTSKYGFSFEDINHFTINKNISINDRLMGNLLEFLELARNDQDSNMLDFVNSFILELREHSIGLKSFTLPNRYYIPILRGLREFKKRLIDFLPLQYRLILPGGITTEGGIGIEPLNLGNIYLEKTRDDYFSNSSLNIFTGLDIYNKVKEMLLGSKAERDAISKYQDLVGREFFDDRDIVFIPRTIKEGKYSKEELYIKIGDEKEFPIQHLGDGLQSLIILTFPMFIEINNHAMFFIEEPEIYLHPGYQRKLLDIMCNEEYGFDHQFFITTHSNHFLELTSDYSKISIFRMNKHSESLTDEGEKASIFAFSNMQAGDENILRELGVKNSSVFLSNCTIWVEGITDRYYIRKYLTEYQKLLKEDPKNRKMQRYEEDTHYSFVEYGGNNITHFSFLNDDGKTIDIKKLCSRLFLITDWDKGTKTDRQAKLEKDLGDRYYCLKANEIENTLSPETLVNVVKEYEGEDFEPNVEKYDFKDYQETPIGFFIEEGIFRLSQFTNEDIENWNGLISGLKSEETGKRIIYTLFDDTGMNLLAQFDSIENMDDEIRNKMIIIFNGIIDKEDLFEQIKNAPEVQNSLNNNKSEPVSQIKKFLKRGVNNLSINERRRLNRLLMEIIFPNEIKKVQDVRKNRRKQKREGGYAENSGTIKSKLNFCEKAIDPKKNYITSQTMSAEAKELAEKLYKFIEENNS